MFEPVHGSAPDIFGQRVANPVDMIWSGALMLEFLCETQTDELIVTAAKEATSEGPVLTPDFKGEVKTVEVGNEITAKLHRLGR
jgi:tartrate dehydrogenase/decarboxylase/D-malate dehydrogenase